MVSFSNTQTGHSHCTTGIQPILPLSINIRSMDNTVKRFHSKYTRFDRLYIISYQSTATVTLSDLTLIAVIKFIWFKKYITWLKFIK